MLPFSRRSRQRDEALSDSDIVEVSDPSSDRVSSSGVVAKAACAEAVASTRALESAPEPAASVDVLFDDDPSIPGPPAPPSPISPLASSVAIPIDLASDVALPAPSKPMIVERPLPSFRSSSPSLPSFPVEPSSTPFVAALAPTSDPDLFTDDEPTRPLGTLPPPPFPRHLGANGEDPPTVRIGEGYFLPPISVPPAPGSSLAPVASDASPDRHSPTMRVRTVELDEDDLRLVRRRPSFAWAAALMILGAGAGIGAWEAVQAIRGDDALASAPPPALVAAAAPAPIEATPAKVEAPKSEASKDAPVNEAPKSDVAKTEAKPAEKIAAKSEAPKTEAPHVEAPKAAPHVVAMAAPAKKPVAPPIAEKQPTVLTPPPGVAKGAPRPSRGELTSDAQADALAKAQLKAALR